MPKFWTAKRWETAQDWASRGIAIYGEDAARPEVVEDLRKRVQYAIAKIESASGRRPPRPSVQTVTTDVDGESRVRKALPKGRL